MVSFEEAVKTCICKKYFKFSGRATRAEFWWFQLFYLTTLIVLFLIGYGFSDVDPKISDFFEMILIAFCILMFFPALGVKVRRLHDTNHSGWNILLELIPIVRIIGAFYVLYLECSSSDPFANDYGPCPNATASNVGDTSTSSTDGE